MHSAANSRAAHGHLNLQWLLDNTQSSTPSEHLSSDANAQPSRIGPDAVEQWSQQAQGSQQSGRPGFNLWPAWSRPPPDRPAAYTVVGWIPPLTQRGGHT
jgi:hypothetical protein